jgi:flagellar basal-body rod protein FlgG
VSNAFYIAATGMQAQQLNLDTIANNLANINTMGFKKGRVTFNDLVVSDSSRNVPSGPMDPLAALPRIGAGVGSSGVSRVFDTGELRKTDSVNDIAINGAGFLEVTLADGGTGYVRGGSLKVNAAGQLTLQGQVLKPGIALPQNVQDLSIAADGQVRYRVSGQSAAVDAGQLQLVSFASPGDLVATGQGVYRASDASGEAITGHAGQEGLGSLVQGALEASNVNVVDEMVAMMVAQRGYEASMKAVQAADELAGMVNGLRK